MKRLLVALAVSVMLPTLMPAAPAIARPETRPDVYHLDGAPDGSKFEGIGADRRRGLFYVSEVTGGEIHRGAVRSSDTELWLDGNGTDGRFTARGITTDRQGNIYVAGGPNGLTSDRPDLWVYSRTGELLAKLRAPADNVFLNDVWVGPDGAAYFTNSNAPQIFRVSQENDGYDVVLWADATDTIETPDGFNLGGIVATRDREALVVAQGTTGQLWRFDLDDASVTLVRTRGVDLTNADGLVRGGNKLTVIRNFSRVITTLRITSDGSRTRLVAERASDPDRVLTTAKALRGRILYVDSHFDEEVASAPYEILIDPFVGDRTHRGH